MTRRAFPALLLVATATAAAACLGRTPFEDVSSAAAPIVGGSPDAADFAVVALVQQSTGTLCSGTLVAANVVLTAAHCVYRVAATDLQVLVGQDQTSPTQTIAVSAVAAYPTYTDEDTGLAGGIDLGVVYLAEPASATPIAVSTALAPGFFAGADVTLVGYGVDSTTSGMGAGQRRSVTLAVDQVCSRVLTAGGPDANACFGDSGGAVLLGGELVAVVSSGSGDCATPSLQTRLDAHADWIAAVLAGNASSPCPTCVAPDPSCGASTETQAATTAADAGGASPGRGQEVGASGGCAVSRGGREREDVLPGWLALLVLAVFRRRAPSRERPSPSG